MVSKNCTSRGQDVSNGSRIFNAFVTPWENSALTLTQNLWRSKIVLKIHLRLQLFLFSNSWSFYSIDKMNLFGLFTNVSRIHSIQLWGCFLFRNYCSDLSRQNQVIVNNLTERNPWLCLFKSLRVHSLPPWFQFGFECNHFIFQ